MLRMSLHRRSVFEKFVLITAPRKNHLIRNTELSLGEGSRLIKYYRLDVPCPLKCSAVPYQKTILRRDGGRDRNHQRNSKSKSVRTCDHHYCYCPLDRKGKILFHYIEPYKEGYCSSSDSYYR